MSDEDISALVLEWNKLPLPNGDVGIGFMPPSFAAFNFCKWFMSQPLGKRLTAEEKNLLKDSNSTLFELLYK